MRFFDLTIALSTSLLSELFEFPCSIHVPHESQNSRRAHLVILLEPAARRPVLISSKNLIFPLQSPLCNLRNAAHPQHLISRAATAGARVRASDNPLARLSAPHCALCPCLHRAPLAAYLGPGCASLPAGALGGGNPHRNATRRLHPVQCGAASMRGPERGRNGIEANRRHLRSRFCI